MKTLKPKVAEYAHVPAIASTALSTLKGILDGVTCDQKINDLERVAVIDWIDRYVSLKKHPAMASLFDYLSTALADRILTLDESHDIQSLISKNLSSFYDDCTSQIQHLHGLLSGVVADKEINPSELVYIWDWVNDNESLKGIFPYDEIYSIVCQAKPNQPLTKEKHDQLVKVFNWTDSSFLSPDNPFMPWAIDPVIEIQDRVFCITGVTDKMSRAELKYLIERAGGTTVRDVSQKVDYLLVCAQANWAWTHAAYGRKIEAAIKLRRNGAKLLIVAEADFWDSLE